MKSWKREIIFEFKNGDVVSYIGSFTKFCGSKAIISGMIEDGFRTKYRITFSPPAVGYMWTFEENIKLL